MSSPTQPHMTKSEDASKPARTKAEIAFVQERYATRIKARLSAPNVDIRSARDGILDCFVATYFGGLKEGIGGYLGIDASEEHVARIAKALFKKKLVTHGASFEAPTIEALDKVRGEVDKELHFHDLPAELRGMHDQVCSLMLSKAEGTLGHAGARSVVKGSVAATQPGGSRPTPTPSTAPSSVSVELRGALATYLRECADAVLGGEDVNAMSERLARVERLVATLRDFE